jgi:hypothetical protein
MLEALKASPPFFRKYLKALSVCAPYGSNVGKDNLFIGSVLECLSGNFKKQGDSTLGLRMLRYLLR